eukprot:NODE_2547_length_905_cov_21.574766_g2092_i0.p1 GENE.NODE_2547_length_905_cov_21.574766_g2092_i0~~NODE_2547_length_905_cov_21.574766_g2092_i0.p1  ORF type:complete len:188 (+),score=45.08 NODE_2547_length_905_cov_21.574766_g2092_i0:203-766(+)
MVCWALEVVPLMDNMTGASTVFTITSPGVMEHSRIVTMERGGLGRGVGRQFAKSGLQGWKMQCLTKCSMYIGFVDKEVTDLADLGEAMWIMLAIPHRFLYCTKTSQQFSSLQFKIVPGTVVEMWVNHDTNQVEAVVNNKRVSMGTIDQCSSTGMFYPAFVNMGVGEAFLILETSMSSLRPHPIAFEA